MILSIESSIPTFKTIRFHAGLNIQLADKQPESTLKQTRNSAGKTSLIEIIHFLHGSDCDKDSLFRTAKLLNHSFIGRFLLKGQELKVIRSGSDPSKIYIMKGNEEHPELITKTDKASGRAYVSNAHWKAFLGNQMFGLPVDQKGTVYDTSFTPSFRSLFSYFARRTNAGGLTHVERQAEQQQRWDWQVNLSYLLGLDWQIPFEFQAVRAREKTLEELKKAARTGALGEVIGTVAELRPMVAIAETKAQRLRNQLSSFEVLESYKSKSREAAHARMQMQAIGREAVSLYESLEHLELSLTNEKAPGSTGLKEVYAAVGVELPEIALRRFEEVNQFHESVIENRRAHLEQEIAEIKRRIQSGESKLAELDTERSRILQILEGRGALEDFHQMQHELAECEATAASLKERFKSAEILEGEATLLDIDRSNLKRRLQEDHHQRKATLDVAILLIAEAISELYDDRSGRFVVDATENGPEFHISIEGDRGGGISSIEIFCFDLTLAKLTAKRFGGPGFLIHDSHLFDGVDERQIAQALKLGAEASREGNLQYIVTMNSDIFDRLPFPPEFDRSVVVLPTRLSDETETGGLFGFRFN